jgi:pimeloyl-ACP methyl ester carboxylesterase
MLPTYTFVSILWASAVSLVAARCSSHDLGFAHTRHNVVIGSNVYNYLLSEPESDSIGTIFLLHGFPDLSFGWRYQIPAFTAQGYKVIAPDMLGYGRTTAPKDTDAYALKQMSEDLAELIKKIEGPEAQVILGGHDWGGALVYRAALYQPELYRGIFSVCTPYFPPVPEYVDLADQIEAGITPTFGYQLQFRNESLDAKLKGKTKIRQVHRALYGGQTPEGELGFDARTGLIFENMPRLGSSPLVGDTDLEYYVREYAQNTMRGPLSWYRTAKTNFDDELPLAQDGDINFAMPGLYIGATHDTALPPSMSEGMEAYFPEGLARGEVVSSHWALWQAAAGVNKIVLEWISELE